MPSWGGIPTNQKLVILKSFSHRSESSEPHIMLSSLLRGPAQERGTSRALGFEGQQGLLIVGAPQNWGNTDFTLKGHTQILMHTGTRGKSSNLIGSWVRPTCWSWRVSWRCAGDCGSPRGHRRWCCTYWAAFNHVNTRAAILALWHQGPAPPSSL